MVLRALCVAALLPIATPAFAQAAPAQANASNWDIFLKLYPKRALAAREEGAVGFVVTLDNRGDVTDCKVTHSSGHPLLDGETCKLVTMNAVFKPDPNIALSQTRTHEGLIAWKLPHSGTLLQPPAPLAPANSAAEKVICKKFVVTGSFASVERTCMTQREWNHGSDETKEMWADIQGKKGSSHGN